MTSLYSSEKRTRVHNQGNFQNRKISWALWLYLNQYHLGLLFRTKTFSVAFRRKKSDLIRGKYSYPRPGSKSTSIDRESADKASVSVDLHLGIRSFLFN